MEEGIGKNRKREREEEQDAKILGVTDAEILDTKLQEEHEKKRRAELADRLEKFRVAFWEQGQKALRLMREARERIEREEREGNRSSQPPKSPKSK